MLDHILVLVAVTRALSLTVAIVAYAAAVVAVVSQPHCLVHRLTRGLVHSLTRLIVHHRIHSPIGASSLVEREWTRVAEAAVADTPAAMRQVDHKPKAVGCLVEQALHVLREYGRARHLRQVADQRLELLVAQLVQG
jgi:hypothetical protein